MELFNQGSWRIENGVCIITIQNQDWMCYNVLNTEWFSFNRDKLSYLEIFKSNNFKLIVNCLFLLHRCSTNCRFPSQQWFTCSLKRNWFVGALYLRNLFFLAAMSLWLEDLRTLNDLFRLSIMCDTVKLLLSRYPNPAPVLVPLLGLVLVTWLLWMLDTLMTLTQPPPMSLMTSSSLSRQFSLAEEVSLCLNMSRELWLLLRLITDSLRFPPAPARLGMEMVRVSARLRRRNFCLAVFFPVSMLILSQSVGKGTTLAN